MRVAFMIGRLNIIASSIYRLLSCLIGLICSNSRLHNMLISIKTWYIYIYSHHIFTSKPISVVCVLQVAATWWSTCTSYDNEDMARGKQRRDKPENVMPFHPEWQLEIKRLLLSMVIGKARCFKMWIYMCMLLVNAIPLRLFVWCKWCRWTLMVHCNTERLSS